LTFKRGWGTITQLPKFCFKKIKVKLKKILKLLKDFLKVRNGVIIPQPLFEFEIDILRLLNLSRIICQSLAEFLFGLDILKQSIEAEIIITVR